MNNEIRTLMTEKVGDELNKHGFYLVDSTRKYAVYHRKNDNCNCNGKDDGMYNGNDIRCKKSYRGTANLRR